MEPIDGSQLRRDETEEQVEKRGRGISGGVQEGGEILVAAGGEAGGKLESANGLQVGNKSKNSTDGSKDGQKDVADKTRGAVEASVSTRGGKRPSRYPTTTSSVAAAANVLQGKNVLDWTAADVQTWVRALPRGLAAFAEAEAFANGWVDGKKLATLTLTDIKRKEFRHAKFTCKVKISFD